MAIPEIVEQSDTRLVLRANDNWMQVPLAIGGLVVGIILCSAAASPGANSSTDAAWLGLLLFAGSVILALSFSIHTWVLDRESDALVHTSRTYETRWRQRVEPYSLAGVTAVTLGWSDDRKACSLDVRSEPGTRIELASIPMTGKTHGTTVVQQLSRLGRMAEQVAAFLGAPIESDPEFRGYHEQAATSVQPPIKCPGCGAYLDPPGRRSGKITCRYCGAVVPLEQAE